jgi:hypothetical protein
MTAIGRFTVLSETAFNPSIVTFFMTLSGPSLTSTEFQQLWKDRDMPAQHPRFHSTLSAHKPGYFQQHHVVEHETDNDTENTDSESLRNKKQNLTDFLSLHISEALYPVAVTARKDLTARITALQTDPWPLTESLWHVYVATTSKNKNNVSSNNMMTTDTDTDKDTPKDSQAARTPSSVILFRGHHALADGASMGAALLDLCDEAVAMKEQIADYLQNQRRARRVKAASLSWWQLLCQQWYRLAQLCAGSLAAVVHQLKLYVADIWELSFLSWSGPSSNPWHVLKQEAAEEAAAIAIAIAMDTTKTTNTNTPTRNVSFSQAATVEQAKFVAVTLGGKKATINDVFCSCVTAALVKQLAWHRERRRVVNGDNDDEEKDDKNSLPRQRHMNIAVPVHLKGGVILPGESVSNQLGAFCVRLPGEDESLDSAERLQAVHKELYSVKRTPAAFLSHWVARTLTQSAHILPASWVPFLFSKASAGAVAVVTNTRGTPQHVHMGGRRVESIYGFVPLPPGIPVGVVVSSYAGSMALTVTAEPYAIPDADRFMSWVLEEYLSLLNRAKAKHKHVTKESN